MHVAWKYSGLEMWWCMVSGSNLAYLKVVNSEDRQSHFVYCKISGQNITKHKIFFSLAVFYTVLEIIRICA